MSFESILEKVKANQAYWRVNVRPDTFEKSKIKSLDELRTVIEKCSVYLRGWPYPYNQGHYSNNDSIECFVDYQGLTEVWRLYQSMQFIQYFSFDEYFRRSQANKQGIVPGRSGEEKGALNIVWLIYQVSELVEFISRMMSNGYLGSKTILNLQLFGYNGYLLTPNQGSILIFPSVCKVDKIVFEREYESHELLSEGESVVIEICKYIFNQFNWKEPNIRLIQSEREKLLKRLI